MAASDDVSRLLGGFRVSAAIAAVAELGVLDLLADGPRDAADLAGTLDVDADTLHRLLHALATVGVVTEDDGSFASTPVGDVLRTDAPGSLRPLARTFADPAVWSAWGHLADSVRTGANAFTALHGHDVWAHRREHPEQSEIFNANMAAQSAALAGAVASAYDLSGRRHAVDVGGGRGVLLEEVLSHNEHLTGTVFDQPHVVPTGPSERASASVAERWSATTGSFFEAVPAADVYLLKWILHDWPDDACVQTLRTCRRSLDDGGVVLVVETLLDRPGHEAEAAFSDLNMLVLPGGRERTADEYAALFDAAALHLVDVVHTATSVSVLVAQG